MTRASFRLAIRAKLPCLSVSRHGHEFVVSGTRTQQREFEEQLSKHLIVKHLATLGPCTALGDVTEIRIVNRKDCEMGQDAVRIGTSTY